MHQREEKIEEIILKEKIINMRVEKVGEDTEELKELHQLKEREKEKEIKLLQEQK